uniref:CCR4-NOT transcription complex subunit 10 n=1 Tax=Anthurium amnicola TaxID=1678845 RepID=A0A1D1Y0A6_9ARAE
MDARDSSSAPAPGRGADGRVDDDDAGVMAATCGMARDAALLFQGGHFGECVEVLSQILQKKQDDPKVLHNIALAEFFHDGCSDPRKLLDMLNEVKKKSEDLTRPSLEEEEVVGSLGSNSTAGSKGSGISLHQLPLANSSTITFADELDTSIAVILFHLHEYAQALSLLEPLYQKLHPLDETVALHVCLLLIDIALVSNDASRAADVIQYMEKSFGVGYMTNQGENGNIAQHQSSSHSSKVIAASGGLAVPDAVSSDSSASENTLDRTLSEDAIEYENLLSTLDNSGQNMTRSNANDLSRASSDRPVHAIDLKLKIHLYKVRLLLLTRNLKAAKREVKLGMNVARGRDSSIALLLKSQLEYARGNHRKAIKLLLTSSNKTEPGVISMFNNNLGCIYHQLQKHHTSIAFFSKALRSSSSLRVDKPLKLSTFSQDKSFFIIYNCGLQYLACGKPLMAARCFHKATLVFYNRPLFWLRLAECCLLSLEKGLLKPNLNVSSSGSEHVKLHVVGSGKWRQLVVNMHPRNGHSVSISGNSSSSDDDQCTLSIPFARQCLLNALHLLSRLEPRTSGGNVLTCASEEVNSNHTSNAGIRSSNHKSAQAEDLKSSNAASLFASVCADGDSKENKGGTGSSVTLQSSVSAYEEICRNESHIIKQAVLVDLAYIELCLENPLRALSVAEALQQLPDCSRMYVFFGHVYAAEALCHLNRPEEAAEHLSVYMSEGNNVELPYGEDDREMWDSEKVGDGDELNGSVATRTTSSVESKSEVFLRPEQACGTLYVNLAAVSAMQDDLEQAKLFLRKARSASPNNPQVLLAAVYVDLRLGNTSDAIVKLKLCSHVRFFPNGITLSSLR